MSGFLASFWFPLACFCASAVLVRFILLASAGKFRQSFQRWLGQHWGR